MEIILSIFAIVIILSIFMTVFMIVFIMVCAISTVLRPVETIKELENACTTEIPNFSDIYLTPAQAGFFRKTKLVGDYIIIEKNIIMASVLHYINNGYITVGKIKRTDGRISYRLSKSNSEVFKFTYELPPNKETIEKMNKYKIAMSDVFIMERIIFDQYNHITIERISEFYDTLEEVVELKLKLEQLKNIFMYEFIELGICNLGVKSSIIEKLKDIYYQMRYMEFYKENYPLPMNKKRITHTIPMD